MAPKLDWTNQNERWEQRKGTNQSKTRPSRMEVSPYSYRSPYFNLKLPLDLRTLGDHQILLDHQTPYTILSFEITLGPSHTWEKLRSEPQAAHVFFVFKKKGFFHFHFSKKKPYEKELFEKRNKMA